MYTSQYNDNVKKSNFDVPNSLSMYMYIQCIHVITPEIQDILLIRSLFPVSILPGCLGYEKFCALHIFILYTCMYDVHMPTCTCTCTYIHVCYTATQPLPLTLCFVQSFEWMYGTMLNCGSSEQYKLHSLLKHGTVHCTGQSTVSTSRVTCLYLGVHTMYKHISLFR